MFTLAKTAMCVAIAVGVASAIGSAAVASKREQAGVTFRSDQHVYPFGRAPIRQRSACWVPTRDDSGEYGADTRGLGYWGSCSEKGAVPFK